MPEKELTDDHPTRRSLWKNTQPLVTMSEKPTKVLKLPTLKLRVRGVKIDHDEFSSERPFFTVDLTDVHDDSIIDNADVILEVLHEQLEHRIEDAITAREIAYEEAKMERAHRHD